MNETRKSAHRSQGAVKGAAIAAVMFVAAACSEQGITNPAPLPGAGNHPGFDTSLYPGDATMSAWVRPFSPYEWAGYYLQAPCHRDPSWMGKRAILTSMGWGLAVLYVGQQTFDGVPNIQLPFALDRRIDKNVDSLPRARAGIMVSPSESGQLSGAVTCSRTLLTTEQGITDAIDALTKTASEGFPAGTVIFLDIEHMNAIPASMEAYYRAWVQEILADGRFKPGIYVHRDNATSVYAGVIRAYSDMGARGSALFWVTSPTGFALDKDPRDVGFSFASVWQGIYEVTQTWNGATVNIDVNVATTSSPSSP